MTVSDLRARFDRTFGGQVVEELLRIQVIDRSLALASKLFVAVIPLSIILSAVVPGAQSFGDSMVLRFGLTGAGAAATRALFASSGQVKGAVSVIGLLILVYSVISFTRGLQAVYLDVWQLPAQGLEALARRVAWVGGFVAYSVLLGPLRSFELRHNLPVIYALTATALGAALWMFTPWILLGRRLPWRRLLPSGVITAVFVTLYTAGSTIWLPSIFTNNAERYGLIGIAFGIVTWLFAYAATVVVAIVIAGVWDRRRNDIPTPTRPPLT